MEGVNYSDGVQFAIDEQDVADVVQREDGQSSAAMVDALLAKVCSLFVLYFSGFSCSKE